MSRAPRWPRAVESAPLVPCENARRADVAATQRETPSLVVSCIPGIELFQFLQMRRGPGDAWKTTVERRCHGDTCHRIHRSIEPNVPRWAVHPSCGRPRRGRQRRSRDLRDRSRDTGSRLRVTQVRIARRWCGGTRRLRGRRILTYVPAPHHFIALIPCATLHVARIVWREVAQHLLGELRLSGRVPLRAARFGFRRQVQSPRWCVPLVRLLLRPHDFGVCCHVRSARE